MKFKISYHHGGVSLELPPENVEEVIYPVYLDSISGLMKLLGYSDGDTIELSKKDIVKKNPDLSEIARKLHDTYEQTYVESCRIDKPIFWDDLSILQKRLMIKTVESLIEQGVIKNE